MNSNQSLTNGQRIELFEIIKTQTFGEWVFTPGTVRPGSQYSQNLTRVLDNQGNLSVMFHNSTSAYAKEIKPVGAFVVKKVHTKN